MAGNIRIALCDDSSAWLEAEKHLLEEYAQDSKVTLQVCSFLSGDELLSRDDWIPDALFSDIELGAGKSGIDLVHAVNDEWPLCQIVYVTNFKHYAPEVCATKHLWYVLKDEYERRLPEVMYKLLLQLDEMNAELTLETIDNESVSIVCRDIVSIERLENATAIRMVTGGHPIVPDKLTAVLKRLPNTMFARCHGSHAVNLAHVRHIGDKVLTMDDASTIPLGRRYSESLRTGYLGWADLHAV